MALAGVIVVAVAAIPVTNSLTFQAAMGRIRFAAMDSRDTFYLANLGSFETAQHIHAELAKMATETILVVTLTDSMIPNGWSAFLIRSRRGS
jgi:hypothetical protein